MVLQLTVHPVNAAMIAVMRPFEPREKSSAGMRFLALTGAVPKLDTRFVRKNGAYIRNSVIEAAAITPLPKGTITFNVKELARTACELENEQ